MASGVAVITTRREDGEPCGLAATAVVSYSAAPPSLLVSVSHASRCHASPGDLRALRRAHPGWRPGDAGAHVRRQGDDKFGALAGRWDEDVPELNGALAYLRCRRAENFTRYDHTVLVGDIAGGHVGIRRAAAVRAAAHGLGAPGRRRRAVKGTFGRATK